MDVKTGSGAPMPLPPQSRFALIVRRHRDRPDCRRALITDMDQPLAGAPVVEVRDAIIEFLKGSSQRAAARSHRD